MSSRDVRSEATRRANLIEVLRDAHESCPEIPEEAAERWTEEAIRRWFSTNGAERPDDFSAAMAALDVDGTPLPPSTRPDGVCGPAHRRLRRGVRPHGRGQSRNAADTTPARPRTTASDHGAAAAQGRTISASS